MEFPVCITTKIKNCKMLRIVVLFFASFIVTYKMSISYSYVCFHHAILLRQLSNCEIDDTNCIHLQADFIPPSSQAAQPPTFIGHNNDLLTQNVRKVNTFTYEELNSLYIRYSTHALTKEQLNLIYCDTKTTGYKKIHDIDLRFQELYPYDSYFTDYTINLTLSSQAIAVTSNV